MSGGCKRNRTPTSPSSPVMKLGPPGSAFRGLDQGGHRLQGHGPTTIYEKKGGNRTKTDREMPVNYQRPCIGALSKKWSHSRPRMRRRGTTSGCAMTGRPPEESQEQLKSFLLRKGKHYPEKGTSWTLKYRSWLRTVTFASPVDQLSYDEYHAEIYRLEEAIERFDLQIEDTPRMTGTRKKSDACAASGESTPT